MKKNPKNVRVVDHPLLQHHLTYLRKRDTDPPQFRRTLGEITRLLAYEATRDLKLGTLDIETPLERVPRAPGIVDPLVIVSIMRAGNGMLSSVIDLFPFAKVGHVGIYRDKFIQSTVEYFFRLPDDVRGKPVLLLDPLLATGDTAVAAVTRIKQYGAGPIRMLSLLVAPEGVQKMAEAHPDTEIYCLSVERTLNEKGYILPGLGDAGDRLYGTLV